MADSFRDLIVWQKSMALVKSTYLVTDQFPAREIYGLTNQVRRSAVSIPSNIAEGKGRQSKKEFVQFMFVARGSLCELRTQLEISVSLGFLDSAGFEKLDEQSQEVGRLMNGLLKSLTKKTDA